MKLRTRLVAIVAMLALLLGLALSQLAPPASAATATDTNGCVVVPSLKLGFCIGRL